MNQRQIAKVLLAMIGLMSIFMTIQALQVSTKYSFDQFLPKDHVLLKTDKWMTTTFKTEDTTPFIAVLSLPKGQSWLQTKNLNRLEKISDHIASGRRVASTTSLTKVNYAFPSENAFLFGTLPELIRQGLPREDVSKNPLLAPNIISKDLRHTLILVSPERMTTSDHANFQKNLGQRLDKHLKNKAPQVSARFGGPASIRTELLGTLTKEIFLLMSLAMFFSMLTLRLIFKDWFSVAVIFGVLVVTNLFGIGSMKMMGISFNVLTATVPVLITICALTLFCHTLIRMGKEQEQNHEALNRTLKSLLLPHFLAACTTSAGFATLLFSDVPVLRDYGVAAAVSVSLTSFIGVLVIWAVYSLFRWPVPRPWVTTGFSFYNVLLSNYSKIAIIGVACTMGLYVLGSNLKWNSTLFSELPKQNLSLKNTEFLSRHLGGVLSLDFAVGSNKNSEIWKEPRQLKTLEAFAKQWRKDPRIGSLITSVDFFNGGMKSGIKSKQAVSEAQFLYGMADNNPLEGYISSDGKWTRISIRTPDLPADQIIALKGQIIRDLKKRFPKQQIKSGGTGAIVPEMNNQISKHLMLGFFQSLFWIVLILWIMFKNLRWALVACIPNFIPPAMLLAALAITQTPIKPGIAIIFSISLGFAFDNTIYLLSHLRRRIKEQGPLTFEMLIENWNTESKTCFISYLCISVGFAVFLISSFPVNQTFGLFMLLAIVGGLLGDVVWLPCVLMKWKKQLIDAPTYKNLSYRTHWGSFLGYGKRFSPIAIFLALGIFSAYAASAAPIASPDSVFKKIMENSNPPNEKTSIKMVTTGPGGFNKVRSLTILRKNESDQRALVRIESPPDLKGVSLLSISDNGKDSQYLYLPSSKKARRILGSSKKGKFLDSEIAFEDMSISTYADFDNRIIKQDKKFIEIESRAKKGSDSSYGRVITRVALPNYHIHSVAYYNPAGKLIKTSTFSNYKNVGGPFWRANKLTVKSLESKRTTVLQVKSVNLKPIDESEVSLESLEE